jgi:hypothetical protein
VFENLMIIHLSLQCILWDILPVLKLTLPIAPAYICQLASLVDWHSNGKQGCGTVQRAGLFQFIDSFPRQPYLDCGDLRFSGLLVPAHVAGWNDKAPVNNQ